MVSPNLFMPNQANIETLPIASPWLIAALGAAGSVSIDTLTPWTGTGDLEVVSDGSATFQSISLNVMDGVFQPNATYTFSVYLRWDGVSHGGVAPVLRIFCEANDQATGNIKVGNSVNVTLSTAWQRFTVTATMPATMANGATPFHYVGLRVDTGGTAQAVTFFMDGLQVEAGAAATAWQMPDPDMWATASGTASFTAGVTLKSNGAAASAHGTAAMAPKVHYQPPSIPASASLLALFDPNIEQNQGKMGALTVTIAGQDISGYVDEFSLDIESVLGQGAGTGGKGMGRGTTCSFLCYLGPASGALGAGQAIPGGGTPSLVRQGEVIIMDATNTRIFGGYASKLDDASGQSTASSGSAQQAGSVNVATVVSCHDYWVDLDRVEVNEVYTGYDDVQIIKALLTKYAPWIDQSQLPAGGSYVFDKRYIRASGLRQAIQKVADVVGWQVWVDPYAAIHYVSPTTASSAPFDLSDMPNGVDTFGYTLTNYTVDDNAIINRVYFYGGKNVSPDFDQDLSVQANGVNTTFTLAYFPHDAADGKIHVIKNSVELVMYSVFDTNPAHKLKGAGGTADVLINADAEVLTFDTAPLKTDTLICRYRYNTPLVVVLSNQQSNQFFGRWYDGKISDDMVFDTNTALQRCRILLAQQAFGLTTLQLRTWEPGLQAGQLVHVINGLRGLDATYQIQKVTVVPVGNGWFEFDLDLGAWNYNLFDLWLNTAQLLQPTDTTTEEDTSVIQAQEQAAATTAAITVTKATRTSGVYYSRTSPVGDGHDAWCGFFTITS